MDGDLLNVIVELATTIIAFLIGRYLLPSIKLNITSVASQFEMLLSCAESFCSYSRQFLDCSGKEKMDNVVEKLKDICNKYGLDVDDETLRAIGQKAYDSMIADEKQYKSEAVNTEDKDLENTEDPIIDLISDVMDITGKG